MWIVFPFDYWCLSWQVNPQLKTPLSKFNWSAKYPLAIVKPFSIPCWQFWVPNIALSMSWPPCHYRHKQVPLALLGCYFYVITMIPLFGKVFPRCDFWLLNDNISSSIFRWPISWYYLNDQMNTKPEVTLNSIIIVFVSRLLSLMTIWSVLIASPGDSTKYQIDAAWLT